jgi:hypothetical protein
MSTRRLCGDLARIACRPSQEVCGVYSRRQQATGRRAGKIVAISKMGILG